VTIDKDNNEEQQSGGDTDDLPSPLPAKRSFRDRTRFERGTVHSFAINATSYGLAIKHL
jgi:hypothetical protein